MYACARIAGFVDIDEYWGLVAILDLASEAGNDTMSLSDACKTRLAPCIGGGRYFFIWIVLFVRQALLNQLVIFGQASRPT